MAEKDKNKAAADAKAKGAAAQAKARAAKNAGPGFKVADDAPKGPRIEPRLISVYREKIIPALQQQFGYTNRMATPKLEKIVISMGLGKAAVAGEKA